MNPIHSFVLVALTSSLVAQTVVTFPSDHAAIPDGWSQQNWFPYSYGVSRMMAVYESWDVLVPGGRQITRIGFRANGTTIAYGKSLNLEVRMGKTQQTAANILTNFDSNYLGAPQTVFGPALFVMPDLNNVLNPNPEAPYIWVNLTTPYTYDPTENLLVEWRIYANNNGGAAFTYTLDRCRFVSPITTGPIGCMHSGNQIPSLLSRPTKIGSTWYCDLSSAPANQLAVWFINLGTPLQTPYALQPFLGNIDPLCQGQVSLVNLFSVTDSTNAQGYKSFSVPIPNALGFNDLTISSQAVCFDFFAPGGIVVSNGDQMQIGIEPAMSVLWNQGSATAVTGLRNVNYGVVTLFEHN